MFHQRRGPLLLLQLLLLLLSSAAMSAKEQKFAIEPMDQVAIVDSHVTLPCRVENKRGILQWTRDDFALGADRDLPAYSRYTMIGANEEGDYSLDISPVTLEDDARFQCQVSSPGPGISAIRSRFASITVLVPPEPPRIVQGPYLMTTEDREIELECISRGGKPAAEITWIDGYGNVITNGIETITEPLPDGKRITAKSILKLTPKKEHHNLTFTCQAQNQADRNYKSARLRLEVKFAPKVSVSVLVPSGRPILEYDEVRLVCHAEANPSDDLVYKWYINDEQVSGEYTTELLIPNVTRVRHDAIVKCEVHNAVGKSEESETIDISYGPRFRSRPMSVEAEKGANVTLSCDVDGNPPADIVWLHEDTAKVVGTSTNLTLTVSAETAGRYLCRAHVTGFPEVLAKAHVYQKGPPTIISHNTQFGTLGDNVRLECVVFSVPRPQRIVWSRAGRDIYASSDSDYTILEDPLPEGVKSTLVIRDSKHSHFGSYNCTASNQFGTHVAEIHLRQQEGFRNLEIIFYSVIGSLLGVIVVGALCFCKRNKQPKLSEGEIEPAEKQSKHSDRSSNDSDLKVEIRTSSSLSNMHEPGDSEPGWEERSDAATPRLALGNGGEAIYRFSSVSADYTDPTFPPKTDGQNNNGYVTYVDYNRDYNPPIELQRNSVYGTHILPPQVTTATTMLNSNIDPRFSAQYSNPFNIRTSTNSLPHPHPTPSPAGSSPGVGVVTKGPVSTPPSSIQPQNSLQPLPPAYSATTTRNGAVPQVSRLPNSPTPQFIVPASQAMKRGTLATHV